MRRRQRMEQEKKEQGNVTWCGYLFIMLLLLLLCTERAIAAVGMVLRDRTVAKQEEWGESMVCNSCIDPVAFYSRSMYAWQSLWGGWRGEREDLMSRACGQAIKGSGV